MAVIKDVARLAGVSVSTVSKYLNAPSRLREDTKKRVEAAIKELSYVPSPLARSMRTGKTHSVAVMVPDISNPFYGETYGNIQSALMLNGYVPILYTTDNNPDILKNYLSDALVRKLDGVILCFVDEAEEIMDYIEEIQKGIPIVLLGGYVSNINLNSVVIDVFEGTYKATNHLISLGHTDIGYIGGPEKSIICREKYKGFAKAMNDAGYDINPMLVHHGSDTMQAGYQAARSFVMSTNRLTAVVAEDDFLAIGCLKYLTQHGIKVPDEVAVTGFDDILLSRMYEPPLSTISIPKKEIGFEAVSLILDRIKKPSAKKKQLIFKTDLIVRNSTDKNMPVEFEF